MYKSEWRGTDKKDHQNKESKTKAALITFNNFLERHQVDFCYSMLGAPVLYNIFLGMPINSAKIWFGSGLATFAVVAAYKDRKSVNGGGKGPTIIM